MHSRVVLLSLLLGFLFGHALFAQDDDTSSPGPAQQNDSTIITMDRLFTSYFAPRGFGPAN